MGFLALGKIVILTSTESANLIPSSLSLHFDGLSYKITVTVQGLDRHERPQPDHEGWIVVQRKPSGHSRTQGPPSAAPKSTRDHNSNLHQNKNLVSRPTTTAPTKDHNHCLPGSVSSSHPLSRDSRPQPDRGKEPLTDHSLGRQTTNVRSYSSHLLPSQKYSHEYFDICYPPPPPTLSTQVTVVSSVVPSGLHAPPPHMVALTPFKVPSKPVSSTDPHPSLINGPCSPPSTAIITPLHPPPLPTPISNNPQVSAPTSHLLPPHPSSMSLPTNPHPSSGDLDSSSTNPNIQHAATCPNHLLLPPPLLLTSIVFPAPNHSPYIPNEKQHHTTPHDTLPHIAPIMSLFITSSVKEDHCSKIRSDRAPSL
ncbi:hypothetical protein AMTRI_Chr06g172400 [Amborella trichopoda]